jgi:hypothetical protein
MAQDWMYLELISIHRNLTNSEALSVNNGWTRFIIFTLRDPHLHRKEQRKRPMNKFHKIINSTDYEDEKK